MNEFINKELIEITAQTIVSMRVNVSNLSLVSDLLDIGSEVEDLLRILKQLDTKYESYTKLFGE
jgi:hypothetical protein